MGLNVGTLNNAYTGAIDSQALARVKEQIFNPGQKTVDVSKLDLSKFNRVSLGTDLYAARTNGEVALMASKGVTDFGINLSSEFNKNVQYLNSMAAQSLFSNNELGQKDIFTSGAVQTISENEIIKASEKTSESQDLNKDRRGNNPFIVYIETKKGEGEENEPVFNDMSIFA